jgi:hypothetical protein
LAAGALIRCRVRPRSVQDRTPIQTEINAEGLRGKRSQNNDVLSGMALTRDERLELLYDLQAQLLDAATYARSLDQDAYARVRNTLLGDVMLSVTLPVWLKSHREIEHFRTLSQTKGGYRERREFVRASLLPAFEHVEQDAAPTAAETAAVLKTLTSDEVERVWRLALERKERDPEGALTLARTLLETIIKHILDDDGVEYEKSADLPSLYKVLAENLNLGPAQHDREAFKAILGGVATVVSRLAQLRNSYSDSHGKGRKVTRIAARHAALAVNLAGSVAGFIVETWNERKARN